MAAHLRRYIPGIILALAAHQQGSWIHSYGCLFKLSMTASGPIKGKSNFSSLMALFRPYHKLLVSSRAPPEIGLDVKDIVPY